MTGELSTAADLLLAPVHSARTDTPRLPSTIFSVAPLGSTHVQMACQLYMGNNHAGRLSGFREMDVRSWGDGE